MGYRFTLPISALFGIMLLSGCAGRKSIERPEFASMAEGLRWEAMTALENIPEGTETDPLPEKYWPEAMDSLQPIEMYVHRNNLVVVQGRDGSSEWGVYVPNPLSSYYPVTGDDGFTFTEHKGRDRRGIFSFMRKRE